MTTQGMVLVCVLFGHFKVPKSKAPKMDPGYVSAVVRDQVAAVRAHDDAHENESRPFGGW
jgi:hypothetical protein